MANENSIIGQQKKKTIDTGTITIKGHLLQLPNVAIQISNISGVTVSEVQLNNPGQFFILIGLCMSIVGIILTKMNLSYNSYYDEFYQGEGFTAAIAILLIGVVLLAVGYVIIEGAKRKCLNIYLNGGFSYYIIFSSPEFMNEVLDRFSTIFEEGGTASTKYEISIHDSKFIGSSVVSN